MVLQFGGRFFSTEQWACRFRYFIGGIDGLGPDAEESSVIAALYEGWIEDNINDVSTDLANWFSRNDSKISTAAYLDFVKLNVVGSDGQYLSQGETHVKTWASNAAPQGTTAQTYPQNTVVVSLTTDVSRGKASRGRIYPPTGQIVMATGGRLDQASCQLMANSAATLLTDLANQPGIDLNNPRVCVASDLGEPGPVNVVTGVEVGNVIDTQRRRRNALREIYSAATVTVT